VSRDSRIEGQVFQSIKFEKVELNVPIDKKIFEMPKYFFRAILKTAR
jgi:hypothetical protein